MELYNRLINKKINPKLYNKKKFIKDKKTISMSIENAIDQF